MNILSPAEIAAAISGAACKKAGLSIGKLILLGILAGVYIGFGANLATTIGNDAAKFLGNGVGQLLFGSVFSVGLMLVVIGGAELFTGNNMFMIVGALDGTCSWGALIKNWIVVYLANFVGSLLLVWIISAAFYGAGADGVAASGLFKGAVGAKALLVAQGKLGLSWQAAFARGILCNWLVCMAVWLAFSSKDTVGKIFACFFPIMAFVACGFEHSVANMFFVPIGIVVSHIPAIVDVAARSVLTPDQVTLLTSGGTLPADAIAAMDKFKGSIAETFTWGNFIVKNLIPVTIGNIVGGGIFVGLFYWLAYLKKAKSADTTEATKKAS